MISLLRSIYRRLPGRRSGNGRKIQQCASLRTDANPKGNVLVAYVIDPFLRKEGEQISYGHTHHFESLLIARTFLDLGYNVDVIDYGDRHFVPRKNYDYFVSARTNLEVVAGRLNRDCTIIAHLDTSHYLFNNQAAYSRAMSLRDRRSVACPSIRIIEHNKAIECAHYGMVLGNETTMDTYRYAGTRLFPLPVPSPLDFEFPEKDYSECRKHFLWFGSAGFVHKGLDLVLEAFAGLPDLQLHVCGPVEEDRDFCGVFHEELFHTPNIHTIGWMDIGSSAFREIARTTAAIVYPSCAEGQAGAVVVCLRAGLIPLISRESGLNVDGIGVMLRDCGIDEIRTQVMRIASMPDDELRRLTRASWEYARDFHGGQYYAERYRAIITDIMQDVSERRGTIPS